MQLPRLSERLTLSVLRKGRRKLKTVALSDRRVHPRSDVQRPLVAVFGY